MVASTFVEESIGTTFNRGFWGGGRNPPPPSGRLAPISSPAFKGLRGDENTQFQIQFHVIVHAFTRSEKQKFKKSIEEILRKLILKF